MTILLNSTNVSGNAGFRNDLSSGALASLGAAGVSTLVWDLGAQNEGSSFRQVCSVLIALANCVASSGSNIKAYFSDDGSATDQVPAAACYNNVGGGVNFTGGLDTAVIQIMAMKRFLRVVITNGSTPQGATAKCFAAFIDQ